MERFLSADAAGADPRSGARPPGGSRGMDGQPEEWHHPDTLDDLFKQKARWRPVLVAGALLFAALGLASLVEALRGEPLLLHGAVVAVRIEAFCFRAAATLLCWITGGWLFALARPERGEMDFPG